MAKKKNSKKKKSVSSPRRRMSAKGAHGGGHNYDIADIDDKFKDRGDYLTKDKSEPKEKTTPKLNKDAGYNK